MKYTFSILFTFCFLALFGQNKKEMTPDTYLEWNRIRSTQLSENGNWTKYHLQPEKGDKTLKLHNNKNGKTYTFDRVNYSQISHDEKYLFYTK